MPTERLFRIRPAPIVIIRSLAVPRIRLWRAWRAAEHLRSWLAPEAFTVSAAEVNFRVGGGFSLHMQTPNGHEIVSRGEYTSIVEPERIEFRSNDRAYSCETKVTFADRDSGTRLTIHQDYEVYAPSFLATVADASNAWQATLDRLEAEVDHMREPMPA